MQQLLGLALVWLKCSAFDPFYPPLDLVRILSIWHDFQLLPTLLVVAALHTPLALVLGLV